MGGTLGLEAAPRRASGAVTSTATGKPWGGQWLHEAHLSLQGSSCSSTPAEPSCRRFQASFVPLSSQTWPTTVRLSESFPHCPLGLRGDCAAGRGRDPPPGGRHLPCPCDPSQIAHPSLWKNMRRTCSFTHLSFLPSIICMLSSCSCQTPC